MVLSVGFQAKTVFSRGPVSLENNQIPQIQEFLQGDRISPESKLVGAKKHRWGHICLHTHSTQIVLLVYLSSWR